MDRDIFFMTEAIRHAKIAAEYGEVPVGAVIVINNEIISCGINRREFTKNALYHAEIEAINKACSKLGGWRLWQCEIFVTLEPCPMCAGAIINSRIKRVVFGAYDLKAGSCGSITNLFNMPYNHKPELVPGVMQEECSKILSDFFSSLREQKKQDNKGNK